MDTVPSQFPVSSIYVAVLVLLLAALSLRVIHLRRSRSVSLGDGGVPQLGRAIRAQGNLAEYAPLVGILLILGEANGASAALLHLFGGIVLLGRLMHAWAFSFTASNAFLRIGGMILTITPMIVLALWLLVGPVIG